MSSSPLAPEGMGSLKIASRLFFRADFETAIDVLLDELAR
jgi:hypothetical protein